MATVDLKAAGVAAVLPSRKQQVDELFALIDTNKSDTIEVKELHAMVKLVKGEVSSKEAAEQFHKLDQSKDGKVQKSEFSAHYLDHFKDDTDKKFYERTVYTKKFLSRKPKLHEIFDTFDTDHSGNLSRGEIFRMVRLSKPKFTNDDLNALFKQMDANHDKKVSKDEFTMYYFTLFFNESDSEFTERVEEAFAGRRKVKLQMVFNMYDLDGNGSLDLNEFALMLKLNGRKFVSADVVLETLIKIDKDHNRKVDFTEWMEYMGGLCATMDDKTFNKAVNNMIDAAQASKAESKKKMAAATVAASTAGASTTAASTPAVGSAPANTSSTHVGPTTAAAAHHKK
jgi:Ca2+-binding EF-hand superfamily protein